MPREHHYYVYIVQSSSRRALYIGVTNNLERRVLEHKTGQCEGFTKKYSVTRLVYYEAFPDFRQAISREKQLKGWLRIKKLELVNASNPLWKDLAADWYSPEVLQPKTASG